MQRLPYLLESPSQTAGPYVHIGLIPKQAGFDIFETDFSNVLAAPETIGERIRIEGRVFDGTGLPINDALLEIWQANAAGKYNHPADRQDKPIDPSFRGWGRTGTDFETGLYVFETIKPGRVAAPKGHGEMAPHVSLWIVARGINIGLNTRMYFSDEAEANASDAVIRLIEQAPRRDTLIGKRSERDGAVIYTFDIRLQGDGETVFFDL